MCAIASEDNALSK